MLMQVVDQHCWIYLKLQHIRRLRVPARDVAQLDRASETNPEVGGSSPPDPQTNQTIWKIFHTIASIN